MLWERPIQHSIRPKGEDGFLMPYAELLARAKEDPSLDLERYTAKAPDEHWDEFSYASELVRHDGAIASLLAMDLTLGRIHDELGIESSAAAPVDSYRIGAYSGGYAAPIRDWVLF